MIQEELRRPAGLKPGDKVGLVAPARKVSRAEMQPAVSMLYGWELEVVEGEHLYNEEHQFSGTDVQRAADFQRMLDDPEIKAVFSARGGYGCMRIIDRIDFRKFSETPKWIVGYSDLTVFHSHVHRNFGVQTLHATMPINFAKDEASTESLRRTLFGEDMIYSWTDMRSAENRTGNAEGTLTGGNLSLLYALSNSVSDIDTAGKILFLEDLDEYLYHVDRMMLSLDRAGKLEKLAGLVIGGMDDMKDNAIPFGKTAEQIILDTVSKYDFPVCFGFPAGHGKENVALRLGGKVQMEVSDGLKAILSFTGL
ncbi:MAG: muramoyltetrapeptide carboxypeptidase [Bacteroidetes bacterium]|nr:MAG: muramoyltetrapeptide carboxypeptidase [Bacteroidota bacterium]